MNERATYNRARLTVGDTSYERVRFVLREGQARAFDPNGTLVASGEVDTVAEVGRSATRLTTVDGTEWVAERRGCNCGGR